MTFLKRIETRVLAANADSLDEFTKSYLGTALWSSTDNSDASGGNPLDANYDIHDFSDKALQIAIKDCADFQKKAAALLEGENLRTAGHDFWLTRNGHGAGFWDGDYEKEKGEELTKISKTFKSIDVVVGDDGKLYLE